MPEEDNVREGFLEHDRYIILRDELPDHQRLILVIGYHLGMRRGEILNLRWDQVDWTENLIRLEKRQTKSKKSGIAPLYGELRV
jgi:integrase